MLLNTVGKLHIQVQQHVKHIRILLVIYLVTKATAVNIHRQIVQHHNTRCASS